MIRRRRQMVRMPCVACGPSTTAADAIELHMVSTDRAAHIIALWECAGCSQSLWMAIPQRMWGPMIRAVGRIERHRLAWRAELENAVALLHETHDVIGLLDQTGGRS